MNYFTLCDHTRRNLQEKKPVSFPISLPDVTKKDFQRSTKKAFFMYEVHTNSIQLSFQPTTSAFVTRGFLSSFRDDAFTYCSLQEGQK